MMVAIKPPTFAPKPIPSANDGQSDVMLPANSLKQKKIRTKTNDKEKSTLLVFELFPASASASSLIWANSACEETP